MRKKDALQSIKEVINDAYCEQGMKFYDDFEDEWRVLRFMALGKNYVEDSHLTYDQMHAIRVYAFKNIGLEGEKLWEACGALSKRGRRSIFEEIAAPNRATAKRLFRARHPEYTLTQIIVRPKKENT